MNENTAETVSGVENVSTIAEPFGDGEKVTTVIITYTKNICLESISASVYSVRGRIIESAYTNCRAEKTDFPVDGHYVILTLKYENRWDATNGLMMEHYGQEGQHHGPRYDEGVLCDVSVDVIQIKDITAADGTVYKAGNSMHSTSAEELIIQDFKKRTFTDTDTGITLPYFIYQPQAGSREVLYPLVFFIADAGADTIYDTAVLTQGNGATVWAEPEEQAAQPSIVAAVQYPYSVVKKYGPLTTDDYTWSTGLTAVDNLLHAIIKLYPVDQARIYGTGQSQGCMANIALSGKHPELFTAQYLVAGQWNTQDMKVMKNKKLWITVCEGDTKAFPAMNEAVAMWKTAGADVACPAVCWDPKTVPEEQQKNIDALTEHNASIFYTVFKGGCHMYTWSFAYTIKGIRRWLFSWQKPL